MSWERDYQDKLTTADQAVSFLGSGAWVDYGFCTSHPHALDQALARRMEAQDLTDLHFRGAMSLRRPAVTQVAHAAERMDWNSWHVSGLERKLMAEGLAYYIPMRFSETPRYYREHIRSVDAALLQTAPMDGEGYFSFGLSATHLHALCQCARRVVVEVNRNMPRCPGGPETKIHISQVHAVVEGEDPPVDELPTAPATAVDEAVARLILPHISDGACLQLGVGGMPNAVGSMIARSGLRDLGVHTEIYVDAFADLAQAGRLSTERKQVFAMAAGSRRLYDYLDGNPAVEAAPVDWVNAVGTIAQIDRFVSINNAVEVDLFGQVASETAGTRHISGAGGQMDFVMGAYLSKGGKSFICCSSTVKGRDGALQSRIRPTLAGGSVVTDTRPQVHWLVTEYGAVDLKGTTTWQRAEAVISVAHPDFREELVRQAGALGIWRRSNRR